MDVHRVWAFSVRPARTATTPQLPIGGVVAQSADLLAAISRAADRTSPGNWTDIVFRVGTIDDERGRRRSSETRDALMDLAFNDASTGVAAALSLATRLGRAMDNRSQSHLLVLAGWVAASQGSVTVWAFPRDDAFRFNASERPTVELLENVFSQTSSLRKAARFSGEAHDASFISGQALDFQTGRTSIDVANYWIGRFLDCVLAVTPVAGTELAAGAIRKLNEGLTDPEERQQLNIAVLALRHSQRPTWTLDEIAETLLPPALGERLIASSDRPEMNQARFSLESRTFDRLLATRVFSLESGVVVSSPLGQVGAANDPDKPVVLDGDQLRVAGTIVEDRLRAGRSGRAA
jgi:hypothetical protein